MDAAWRKRFGERLRSLRQDRGLTQEELAERSGMGQGNLARVEQGARGVRVETVLNLARALRVAPGRLLEDEMEQAEGLRADLVALADECDEAQLRFLRDCIMAIRRHWPASS